MNDWTLLIDFGTSFSRAAIADADGRIDVVEPDGRAVMPSGLWVDASGRLLTGDAAVTRAAMAPDRWDPAPGLRLGTPGPLRLGHVEIDPVTGFAAVIRRLFDEALSMRDGQLPVGARLTCPARWDAERRAILLAAARRAGLDSPPLVRAPELVAHPVAVALRLAALGRLPDGARIAVHHLGGGSAETTVLESTPEGVVVLAVGGLDGVGGELFDDLLRRRVIAHAITEADPAVAARLLEPPDAGWRQAGEHLLRSVRRAKEELSEQYSVDVETGPTIGVPVRLDRFELDNVLRPHVLRAARELAATIELAHLRPRQLDGVFVTGGSTRGPLVARAVHDVTGVRPELLPELLDGIGALPAAAGPSVPTLPVQGPATGIVPITTAGRQTGDEAAAAARAAVAAVATTGSIDLSAIGPARGYAPTSGDPADPADPAPLAAPARSGGAVAVL